MDYDSEIQLVIYKNKYIYDYLLISPQFVKQIEYKGKDGHKVKKNCIKFNKNGYNARFISAYIYTITTSQKYRKFVFDYLLDFHMKSAGKLDGVQLFAIKLQTPKYHYLDYYGSNKINDMLIERQNVEYAMSWLSTLGGAFSALGDSIEHCATIAGKISIKQFKLALQLGDPSLVARCKLYAALSLIQRNHWSYPKKIILEVYNFAKKVNDIRLQNMSQGIWAKLKYQHFLKHQNKKKSIKK